MKEFLKPTKDKIILTLVMPSYLFFNYDFVLQNWKFFWLPIPIVLIFIGIFILMYLGSQDSSINFILQKAQQNRIVEDYNNIQAVLVLLIELAIPIVLNYLLACMFFRWYYNRAKTSAS